MNFSQALDAVKLFAKISRDGWNGKSMYVAMSPGFLLPPDRVFSDPIKAELESREDKYGNFRPYLMMRTADGEFVPWVASQTDLLADDWAIIL